MAVTPNYGWPVPVATDYVKDGWDAIADLGNAIDSTVYGLGSGLKKITSQSFTTSSAVNVNNCFSSTYTNYRLMFNLTACSVNDAPINIRMRVGGVDNSTASSYQRNLVREINGSVSGAYDPLTETIFSQANTTVFSVANMDIYNPFLTIPTKGIGGFIAGGSSTTAWYLAMTGFHHTQATSYDGFSIIPSSGTISGTIKVYGYQE